MRFVVNSLLAFAFMVMAGCAGQESGKRGLPATTANPASPVFAVTLTILGMPDKMAGRFERHIRDALIKRRIAVIADNTSARYGLQGFGSIAPGTRNATVAYIWDVSNRAGKIVHRIAGEQEVATTPANRADLWTAVNSTAISRIAGHTADELLQWAIKDSGGTLSPPGQPAATPSTSAPAGAAPPASSAKPASRTSPGQARPLPAPSPPATRAATASAPHPVKPSPDSRPARRTIAVQTVRGAPGDGNSALTRALRHALDRHGFRAPVTGKAAFDVRSTVKVGTVRAGQQSVAIDWVVYDSSNRKLGVVSQKNNVRAGSITPRWGATARMAADAAAPGIISLINRKPR